jgi:hypothetical protein
MKWLRALKIGRIVAAVLEAEGVSIKGVPISTIEKIATNTVKQIKDAKPKPPPPAA